MRTEAQYLQDIIEAADAVERFLRGQSEESFCTQEILNAAVMQKLMVVGEAVVHLSPALQAKYPHIPWPQIRGFRNLVVHSYFHVNWKIIWTTATVDLPLLRVEVRQVLQEEYPDFPAAS